MRFGVPFPSLIQHRGFTVFAVLAYVYIGGHQNGRELTAKRVDDAAAKKIADDAAAAEKRFKDQIPAQGSERTLCRFIEELRTGKPNYDLMSAMLAETIRQQLPDLQSSLIMWGALQSVSFKGVGPGRADIYQAKFEKGSLDDRIWVADGGKIERANVRPSD